MTTTMTDPMIDTAGLTYTGRTSRDGGSKLANTAHEIPCVA